MNFQDDERAQQRSPRGSQGDQRPRNGAARTVEPPRQLRDRLRGWLPLIFAAILSLGLTLILSFNLVSRQALNVHLGEPSSEEVIAPQSRSYVSEVSTEIAQQQAADSIQPVYTPPDLRIGRAQTDLAERIFGFIDTVRADSIAGLETKTDYLMAINEVRIEEEMAQSLLNLSDGEYTAVKADVLRIIEEVMRVEIREETLPEARRQARQRVSFNLTPKEEGIVTLLAPQFVIPNTFFDPDATAARREEAIAAVEPVRRNITQGETILRVGETVDEADIEALQELNLLQRQISWREIGAIFMAATVVSVLLALYWLQFHGRNDLSYRSLSLLTILILVFTLGAKIMLPLTALMPYFFPMAALSMLLAVIFEPRLSLYVTMLLAGLLPFALDSTLEMMAYLSTGGLLAVLTLRDAQRINAFFRAGLIAAVGNVVVILIFRLPLQVEAVELLQLALAAVTNGLIFAAGLTLAGLFIVGSLFGVVTMLQLQELSRLDHPLLRELLRRAPGTYHHSIMVANLAEQAAENIRANATLVRVGAFYHDIGKVVRPPFFTENQEGVNPHDSLDPYSSARIIISHVSDGLEMARHHRLPLQVQDFIATHHGDRLVRAFYVKALEQAGNDPEKVDIERFKHKGPRPHTRETGIVLLADAIEAVSSALRPNTEEAIEKLVNSIVDDDLKTGQLDQTGLTLSDIKQLRASFIETLKGRYHIRVRYPGNEELDEEPREGLPTPASAPARAETSPATVGAPRVPRGERGAATAAGSTQALREEGIVQQ